MTALNSVMRGGLAADAEKDVGRSFWLGKFLLGLLVLDVEPALCLIVGLEEKGGIFLTGPEGKLPVCQGQGRNKGRIGLREEDPWELLDLSEGHCCLWPWAAVWV